MVDGSPDARSNATGYSQANMQLKAATSRHIDFDADSPIALHFTSPDRFVPIEGRLNVLFTMLEREEQLAEYADSIIRSDVLVTCSRFCQEIFERLGRPVARVPLGVDVAAWPKKRRRRLHGQPFRWIYMGSASARKFTILPGIYECLLSRIPGVELYMKTQGNVLDGLQEMLDTGLCEEVEPGVWAGGNAILDTRFLPRPQLVDIIHSAHGGLLLTAGEGWGMCVDPTTLIATPGGVRPMSEIQPGDSVLAGDGLFHRVKGKVSRVATDILRVKATGSPEVVVSSEHPFFAVPGRGPGRGSFLTMDTPDLERRATWIPARDLKPGDFVAYPRPRWVDPLPTSLDVLEVLDDRAGIEADDQHVWLKMGYSPNGASISIAQAMRDYGCSKRVAEDALRHLRGTGRAESPGGGAAYVALAQRIEALGYVHPKVIKLPRRIPLDPEFLYFLGAYVANGDPLGGRGVEICTHLRKRVAILDRVATYLKDRLGLTSVITETGNKANLRCCSTILSRFVVELVGKGAAAKSLRHGLLLSAPQLGQFVRGWFEGDGSYAHGRWRVTTVSRDLAWQMRGALAAVGTHATIAVYPGRDGHLPFWELSVGGSMREAFVAFTGLPSERRGCRKPARKSVVTDGFIFVPIRSVTPAEPGEVQDIEVEGSHDFVGNGVLLHNTGLELMATGLPLVISDHSGVKEYSHSGNSYPVRCEPQDIEIHTIEDAKENGPTRFERLMYPDPIDTMRQMTEVMVNYERASEIGMIGAATAREFSWSQAAKKLHEVIAPLWYDRSRIAGAARLTG